MPTSEELKEKIKNYIEENSLKDNLEKKALLDLKTSLIEAKKLGEVEFLYITRSERAYECWIDEINRKLETL